MISSIRKHALSMSIAAFIVFLFAVGVWFSGYAGYAREYILLLADPSAERAYAYGVRHFDARDPHLYDIERAEYFFTKAAQYDPGLPFVRHQLARIEFLKGDFRQALGDINDELSHPEPSPSSYYIRGLILGFMGRYAEAASDYEKYLASDPTNWAAVNDYAWVLLKGGQPYKALTTLEPSLLTWPRNPWLLNSAAIAAYETKGLLKASAYVQRAKSNADALTEEQWLTAYPGNDPRIAPEGIVSLRASIDANIHTIAEAARQSPL